MLRYKETLPVEEIKKSSEAYIEFYIFIKSLIDVIMPVLEKNEGKKITKRLKTAIEAAVEAAGMTNVTAIYLQRPYSWWSLKFNTDIKDVANNNNFTVDFNLTYGENVSVADFKAKNPGYNGCLDEWIADNIEIINTIDEKAIRWAEAMKTIKEITDGSRLMSKFYESKY